MNTAPTRQIYEYREVESLEDVNLLAVDEAFDLFQAVAVEGRIRYVLRKVRDVDYGRRVGFASRAGDYGGG